MPRAVVAHGFGLRSRGALQHPLISNLGSASREWPSLGLGMKNFSPPPPLPRGKHGFGPLACVPSKSSGSREGMHGPFDGFFDVSAAALAVTDRGFDRSADGDAVALRGKRRCQGVKTRGRAARSSEPMSLPTKAWFVPRLPGHVCPVRFHLAASHRNSVQSIQNSPLLTATCDPVP